STLLSHCRRARKSPYDYSSATCAPIRASARPCCQPALRTLRTSLSLNARACHPPSEWRQFQIAGSIRPVRCWYLGADLLALHVLKTFGWGVGVRESFLRCSPFFDFFDSLKTYRLMRAGS